MWAEIHSRRQETFTKVLVADKDKGRRNQTLGNIKQHRCHVAFFRVKINVSYAPINGLPQDGGVGQPRGNLTLSGFQMSISPPLGLRYKSNSHPWGPQT